MLKIISYLLTATLFIVFGSICLAQDEWQQKLDGWVNDVYYPNLFLGGTYMTRISLVDIDNDGDLDMFYGGGDSGSLVYFENIGTPTDPYFELRFEEYPSLQNTNYYGGVVDVDFADLDNDGDYDAAFSGRIDSGGGIRWNDGNPYDANFVVRYPLGPLSGQSNVTLADIDGDGDYDYFSGQGYRQHQLYFAENYGTLEEPYFLHQGDTTHYQGLDFGVPFNFDMGDIDNDGDIDLIVCKHPGPVAYYENTGTPDSAYFTHVTDDFLLGRDTTDWMETPELADIDADGDLDLFLAGGYAHLYFFENLGAIGFPEFIQRYDTSFFFVQYYTAGSLLGNSVDIDGDGDDDITPGKELFINESVGNEIRFSSFEDMIPFITGCFADMDADYDYDYIAPAGLGTVIYFENSGDSSWPEWEDGYSLFVDGRLQYPFTVAAGDLDNDGDNDVLIGHENSAGIDYYRNDGTSQEWEFSYIESLELPQWEYRGHFNIIMDDIDNDDDLDILIGDTRSNNSLPIRLMYYRNDGTPEQSEWTYITDDFQDIVREHRNGSIVPCLADIDKDGDKDLIMTNNSVGLQLFLNPIVQTKIEEYYYNEDIVDKKTIISIYPNPSNMTVSFSINLDNSTDLRIEIFNILGQSVTTLHSGFMPSGVHVLNWNSSSSAGGIYFVRLLTNRTELYAKFIIIK